MKDTNPTPILKQMAVRRFQVVQERKAKPIRQGHSPEYFLDVNGPIKAFRMEIKK